MGKRTIVFGFVILLLFSPLHAQGNHGTRSDQRGAPFTFAFMTDVHMNTRDMEVSSKGLRRALEHAKSEGVDLVIFGGDLVDIDRLQPEDSLQADRLFMAFKSIVEEAGIKAYFTIGNHDRYYTFNNQPDAPGFNLFQKHLGETYYSFDHKGIHFVVLNSVQVNDSTKKYMIGPEQLEWLETDLAKLPDQTPLVVSTHVPFQSLYYPAMEGVVKDVDMVSNFKEVWDILLNHDLKVILQGHQHLHEELLVNKTNFVTGGAICAAWWQGPLLDTEEGYLLITVDDNNNFSWKYMDYGWDPDEHAID